MQKLPGGASHLRSNFFLQKLPGGASNYGVRSNFYIYVDADCGDAGLGVSTHRPPLNPSAKDTFTPP